MTRAQQQELGFAPRVEGWRVVDAEGARLRVWEGFVPPAAAARLFDRLHAELAWQRDEVRVFGKSHLIPRMHQWYGDAGSDYSWSGLRMPARAWTPALGELRAEVEGACGCRFNSVLANLYRDGRDAMGWHADDEAELGPAPVIASLSLGATRDFVLRRRVRKGEPRGEGARLVLPLSSGSLLVMSGETQKNWEHALPRRLKVDAPRINLTFRRVRLSD